jgi:hypothetical protein
LRSRRSAGATSIGSATCRWNAVSSRSRRSAPTRRRSSPSDQTREPGRGSRDSTVAKTSSSPAPSSRCSSRSARSRHCGPLPRGRSRARCGSFVRSV